MLQRKPGRAPYEPPRVLGRRDLIVDDPLAAQILDRVGSLILLIAFLPNVGFETRYRLDRHWEVNFRAEHYERTGFYDFKQNEVGVGLRYNF